MSRSARWVVLVISLFSSCAIAKADSNDVAACLSKSYSLSVAKLTEWTRWSGQNWSEGEQGTGFVVTSDGFMLTAAHVVLAHKSLGPGQEERLDVVFDEGSPNELRLTGRIVDLDLTLDVALIKLDGDRVFAPISLSNTIALEVGDQVSALGYPSGQYSTLPPETIMSVAANIGLAAPIWITNLGLAGGNSGGPVFGPDGNVVAIADAALDHAGHIGYVVPVSFARDFLDKWHVSVTPANTPGPCKSPGPTLSLEDIAFGGWHAHIRIAGTNGMTLKTAIVRGHSQAGNDVVLPLDIVPRLKAVLVAGDSPFDYRIPGNGADGIVTLWIISQSHDPSFQRHICENWRTIQAWKAGDDDHLRKYTCSVQATLEKMSGQSVVAESDGFSCSELPVGPYAPPQCP